MSAQWTDHAAQRVDAVHAGPPAKAARIARLSAVLAGEHEGDVAVAAADQQPRGVDHAHLPVPRRDAAGNQHHAHLRQNAPGPAQRRDAVGAHRRRTEAGGVDRARDHGDAVGRNLVALDHGARDVARRRDHPVAARQRSAEQRAGPGIRRQPVGERRDQEHRHAVGGGERAPGRAGALGMHDVDALAGDQVRQPPRIAADAQRIERVVRHRQPFAAEGAQFADQRPAVAGNDGAGAGLQQRERDIDRGVAGRIVTQRRHQLQDGGTGERVPHGGGGSIMAAGPPCARGRLAARRCQHGNRVHP